MDGGAESFVRPHVPESTHRDLFTPPQSCIEFCSCLGRALCQAPTSCVLRRSSRAPSLCTRGCPWGISSSHHRLAENAFLYQPLFCASLGELVVRGFLGYICALSSSHVPCPLRNVCAYIITSFITISSSVQHPGFSPWRCLVGIRQPRLYTALKSQLKIPESVYSQNDGPKDGGLDRGLRPPPHG